MCERGWIKDRRGGRLSSCKLVDEGGGDVDIAITSVNRTQARHSF
jgi:hypothetical protein